MYEDKEKNINYSYYEIAYLDDFNNKHLATLYDKEVFDFYRERYTLLELKERKKSFDF